MYDLHVADLNPPLSYLLTRACFALFGANTLSVRLPELGGFILAMVSLYLVVRRRAGTLYGLLTAAILCSGRSLTVAVDARPYALLLGFGAFSLLAWQLVWEKRPVGIPLLVAGGFGLLLSHVFGVYVWTAFAAAEAIRASRCRAFDWRVSAAWVLPTVSAILYVPLVRIHGASLYPKAFQPTFHSMFHFYVILADREVTFVLLAAAAMLFIVGYSGLRGYSSWVLSQPEWYATVLLTASPCLTILQLMHSHAAFMDRYGTTASLGVSILASVLLARWTGGDLRAALLCTVIALAASLQLLFGIGSVLLGQIFRTTALAPPPCEACALAAKINPSLPIVDAGGLTFVEMQWREDASTLDRVTFLTDPAAAAEYAHASIFNDMARKSTLFPFRSKVYPYADFVRSHRAFFVFGDYHYPEDWLLRKLQADGANLLMLAHTHDAYKDRDLYEVTFGDYCQGVNEPKQSPPAQGAR